MHKITHFTSWRFERRILKSVSHRRGKRHDVDTWKSPLFKSNTRVLDEFLGEKAENHSFHIVAIRATGPEECFTSSRQTPRCGYLKTLQYPVKSGSFWNISKRKRLKRPITYRGESVCNSRCLSQIVSTPNSLMLLPSPFTLIYLSADKKPRTSVLDFFAK